MLRPQLPGPVSHFRTRNQKPPGPFPQQRCGLPSIQYAPGGFASKPSSSSVPSGGNSGAAKGVFRNHWQTVLLTQPARFPARA